MKYLVLRLSAPLMAFGEGDYWDIRGTGIFPTKSAIVGILASCFGYDRNETEKISHLSDSISVSARQDNKFSLLRDYHTILDTLKADGKKNPNAVISIRQYLMEAEFSVLISTNNNSLHEQIKEALQNPEWPPFLGRKSCVPSFPIFWNEEIEADNAQTAFKQLPLVHNIKNHTDFQDFFKTKQTIIKSEKEKYACISDEHISGQKTLTRDNVINSKLRVFSQRETYKFYVEVNHVPNQT
jgi:CRISPR-associated protein Cas5/CasD subtype I-E